MILILDSEILVEEKEVVVIIEFIIMMFIIKIISDSFEKVFEVIILEIFLIELGSVS